LKNHPNNDARVMKKVKFKTAIRKAWMIVSSYGGVFERAGQPGILYYVESDLPYTKTKIREAIEFLLFASTGVSKRNLLEVGNVCLDYFLPDDEYRIVCQHRQRMAGALKHMYAGKREAKQRAETIFEGTTSQEETVLRRLKERVDGENRATRARHRVLRNEAEDLALVMHHIKRLAGELAAK
jgi:hypothetical protein